MTTHRVWLYTRAAFFAVLAGAVSTACAGNAPSTLPGTSAAQAVRPTDPSVVAGTAQSTTGSTPNFYCGVCSPPPSGGSEDNPDNCQIISDDCGFVAAEINADLSYSTGHNAAGAQIWTAYPWACVQGANGFWVSSVDIVGCSAWQIYHYFGQYCANGHSPCYPVSEADSIEVAVQMSKAASDPFPNGIPTAGHLYIQGYVLGAQTGTGGRFQGEKDPATGRLAPGYFAQNPLGQPAFFLPRTSAQAYTMQGQLQANTGTYDANFKSGKTPMYNGADLTNGPNSNTYADGLLLSVGVSQSEIDTAVTALQSASGLRAYAYGAGNTLVPLF